MTIHVLNEQDFFFKKLNEQDRKAKLIDLSNNSELIIIIIL